MDSPSTKPSLGQLVRVSAKIGALSFGGPAGQIALMHREFVEDRRWVEDGAFLRALNLCHLLPGPEAQQLATWIGWRLHGVRGGLAAGLLFVIPGAFVMLALSLLYVTATGLDWFEAIFLGIKAAVLAIVAQALARVAGRALKTPLMLGLAVVSLLLLFLFDTAFPLVIAVAAIIGAGISRWRPELIGAHAPAPVSADGISSGTLTRSTVRTIAVWCAIWAAPMALVAATLGTHHVLWDVGVFFSKLAVVTFGGAYAVLGYMAQEAAGPLGWLSAGEMADGLGLAESTPGPLIMVTQFVGFLAGWREAGPLSPLAGAIAAAALTTWVTFAPCFLWIFACAPWMDRLERSPALQGALTAITAAVVGVIANLGLWFAGHVLFPAFDPSVPGLGFDWRAGSIAALAALLLFGFRRGILTTLAACAASGLALGLALP